MARLLHASVAWLTLAAVLLLAAPSAYASPLSIPTAVRQPQASVVPLPDAGGGTTVTPPNASPSQSAPPPTTTPPTTQATTPTGDDQATVAIPAPGASPAVTPAVAPESDSSPSPSPSPTSDDDDGGLSTGAIVGIVIGALLLLLALCLCCFFFCLRRGDKEEQPAVYDQTSAAPPMQAPVATGSGPSDDAMSAPYSPDEARDKGPPEQTAMDRGMDGGAMLPAGPPEGAAAGAAGAAAAMIPAGAIKRGPTPPPHDYVLGAGPAATRGDFIDLRAKFERDEIGDNSAVLGVDRSSSATAAAVAAGAGVAAMAGDDDPAEGATSGEQSGLSPPPPPPPTMESSFGAVEQGISNVSARADDMLEMEQDVQPVALPPPPSVQAPFAAPVATTYGDTELLPDREDFVGVPTFEAQEKMIAGGDGSGAISDAALSINAATIVEETGDVPSLERDPIELSRGRDAGDTTF